ncbi:MAG: hypothetical protein ACPIOQ_50535 [Promethearchaeia archaeon]
MLNSDARLGRALFEQAPVKHARQRQAQGECSHERALISAKRPVERHDLVCWITVRSVTTVANLLVGDKAPGQVQLGGDEYGLEREANELWIYRWCHLRYIQRVSGGSACLLGFGPGVT